ncbi:hypothetical protein SAMN04244548_03063 [Paracoccus pantotrophus]|nr:hypothetical protein SAMN04244548_03063 [Paracoccus pantotrophus]
MFGKTGQVSTHHSCDQRGLGGGFDFNKAAGMKTGLGKLEPEVEPAVAGAEGQAMSRPVGMNAHVIPHPLRSPSAR